MSLARVGLLGWIAGLLGYIGALGVFYGEWISTGVGLVVGIGLAHSDRLG